MNMDTIKLILRKNKISLIVWAVTLVVCGYHFVNKDKRTVLQGEYEALGLDRSRMLQNFQYSAGLDKDIESIEEKLSIAESRLFEEKDLANNYNYFFDIESKTGVRLSGLRQIAERESTSRGKSDPSKDGYRQIGYEVTASGDFTKVINLMRHLEGGEAHYQLKSFSMQPSSEIGQDMVSVKLSFSILGRIES